jgi:hypothetical protein
MKKRNDYIYQNNAYYFRAYHHKESDPIIDNIFRIPKGALYMYHNDTMYILKSESAIGKRTMRLTSIRPLQYDTYDTHIRYYSNDSDIVRPFRKFLIKFPDSAQSLCHPAFMPPVCDASILEAAPRERKVQSSFTNFGEVHISRKTGKPHFTSRYRTNATINTKLRDAGTIKNNRAYSDTFRRKDGNLSNNYADTTYVMSETPSMYRKFESEFDQNVRLHITASVKAQRKEICTEA